MCFVQGKKSAEDKKGDKPRSRPGQFEIFTVSFDYVEFAVLLNEHHENSTMRIRYLFWVTFLVDSR